MDHHYKRLFGFSALTSAFTAAFALSQRNTQSALTYPSVGSTAGAAVGQEMSQTGGMLTRRNMNVQPTIKVPAGYQFTVRVNRDILFGRPVSAGTGKSFAGAATWTASPAEQLHRSRPQHEPLRKETEVKGRRVRLFLRLTADVNRRLRTRMQYHGELSVYINEALMSSDLRRIDLIPVVASRASRGMTAVIFGSREQAAAKCGVAARLHSHGACQ